MIRTSHILQPVSHTGAGLAGFLSSTLGPVLQGRYILRSVAASAVRLDGLLAVGRELGLPVALARLLLRQRVLLVLLRVRRVRAICAEIALFVDEVGGGAGECSLGDGLSACGDAGG